MAKKQCAEGPYGYISIVSSDFEEFAAAVQMRCYYLGLNGGGAPYVAIGGVTVAAFQEF